MSIQYAGGTNVDATLASDGTQATLINWIEDSMNTAGWTTISGHHSATIVLASAATPNSNSIRVRLKTTANACATIELLNAAASLISQLFYLLPTASVTFRIVACQYQVFIWLPGSVTTRYSVSFGVPWVPSFLGTTITGDFGWIVGDSRNDTGSASFTFRLGLGAYSNLQHTAVIMNGTLLILDTNTYNYHACIQLVVLWGANTQPTYAVDGQVWSDGSMVVCEPYIGFGVLSTTDPARIRGQLWDAVVVGSNFAADQTIALDGHTWRIITLNGGVGPAGALAVRSSS